MSNIVRTGEEPPAAKWAELASSWGFSDFLSPEDGFRTCLQSSQRWRNHDQPGIYFWLAEDGEAYVGQSINPRSRLREHWRNHRDIVRACFLPCPATELDAIEARLIKQAGRHFDLRNIKLAVATSREVPFDKLISEDERERFLAGDDLHDLPWRTFELLTQVQKKRYEKFLASSGGHEALRALQTFVSRVIPKPAATEVGFWSVTLFPQSPSLRLNAGQQEVFTYPANCPGSEIRIFSDKRLRLLRSSRARYVVESYIDEISAGALDTWLKRERLLASRRLVVRLMRHTTALNSGSHCPQAVRV